MHVPNREKIRPRAFGLDEYGARIRGRRAGRQVQLRRALREQGVRL